MWELITRVIFLLCAVSSLVASDHFVEDSSLIRVKRSRRGGGRKEIDFDNIDESLYGWEPQFAPGCQAEKYACRDKSYCFPRSSMCDKIVSCDDQSDEINAVCGYTTTPTVPTSTESGITSPSSNQSEQHREEATSGGLGDTLKIVFIAIGVVIVALGFVTATYCLKHKLSGARSDPNQVTPEPTQRNGKHKELETDAQP